jgi:hypothetical protein
MKQTYRKPSTGKGQMLREAAESLAVEALGFIVAEPERLEKFVSLHGLTPANLRDAAAEPGFFAAVLDHLASDEALLLSFAANAGHPPEAVLSARNSLQPPDFT